MTKTYRIANTVNITLHKNHTGAELRHEMELALMNHGWPEIEVVTAGDGKFEYKNVWPEGDLETEYYEELTFALDAEFLRGEVYGKVKDALVVTDELDFYGNHPTLTKLEELASRIEGLADGI